MADNSTDRDPSPAEEAAPEAWEKSESKSLLRSKLFSRVITDAMKPKEIYQMDIAVHRKWKYDSWRNNLYNLRMAFRRDKGRMANDIVSYGQMLQMVKDRYPGQKPDASIWHLSPAKAILKRCG